jgi:hypothetical protein
MDTQSLFNDYLDWPLLQPLAAWRRMTHAGGDATLAEMRESRDTELNLLLPRIAPERLHRLAEAALEVEAARNSQDFEAAAERFRKEMLSWASEVAGANPRPVGAEDVEAISRVVRATAARALDAERKLETQSAEVLAGSPRVQSFVEELRARIERGEIPLFPADQRRMPRKERVDPIKFLREYYGEFLRPNAPPEQRLSQSDLRQVDPRLFSVLRNLVRYRRRQGGQDRLSEILPPLSEAAEVEAPRVVAGRDPNRFAGAKAFRARTGRRRRGR